MYFVLTGIMILIFMPAYSSRLKILIGCVREYRIAPSLAYVLSDEGIEKKSDGTFLRWIDVTYVGTQLNGYGFELRNAESTNFLVDSWGVDLSEMRQARLKIMENVSPELIRNI